MLDYGTAMTSAADDLRSVVVHAINVQLPIDVDERQLPRELAPHLTADRLVREALTDGHAGMAEVT